MDPLKFVAAHADATENVLAMAGPVGALHTHSKRNIFCSDHLGGKGAFFLEEGGENGPKALSVSFFSYDDDDEDVDLVLGHLFRPCARASLGSPLRTSS